jgi:hypothetical protein
MRFRRLICVLPATALVLAQAPATPATTPDVEHVPADHTKAILGARVADAEGKSVGRLIDILVDQAGLPQAAVIDVGGFLGVGNRRIAVQWSALRFTPADPENKIVVDLTGDQIRAAPQYRDTRQAVPVVTSSQGVAKVDPASPSP